MAIHALEALTLTATQRPALASPYSINEWLPGILISLCTRREGPSAEEESQLSRQHIIGLYRAREEFRTSLLAEAMKKHPSLTRGSDRASYLHYKEDGCEHTCPSRMTALSPLPLNIHQLVSKGQHSDILVDHADLLNQMGIRERKACAGRWGGSNAKLKKLVQKAIYNHCDLDKSTSR